MTDWRNRLGHSTMSDLLILAIRKGSFEDPKTRNALVARATCRFVESGEGGFSNRRIKAILDGLDAEQSRPCEVISTMVESDDDEVILIED